MRPGALSYVAAALIALCTVAPALAQEAGTISAPFLLTDYGARAAAVGGAATGGPQAQDALFYNPAALAFIERKTLALQHIEDVNGDNFEVGSYMQPLGERFGIGFSASFIYFTDAIRTEFETRDEFTNYDLALGLSLGYRATSRLALGGTVKYIKEKLFVFDAKTASVDLAALYKTHLDGLSVGISYKDLGRGLKFVDVRAPLPTALRIGAAYQKPGTPWRFTADASNVYDQKTRIGYGAEREIGRYLVLRGGYRHNHDGRSASSFTAGMSVRYDDIAFDYAYIPSPDIFTVGATHRIQSIVNFGRERKAGTRLVREPGKVFTGFRGTMILGGRNISIDNRRIIGLPRGVSPRYDLYAAGNVGKAEATVATNMFYDGWDGYTVRRATASLQQEDVRITAGDFIAQMSPYTVVGREMRGAEAEFTHERDAPPLEVPSGEQLRGLEGPPVNIGRVLREKGLGRESFLSTTMRALAGRTASAVNVGDDFPALNGVKSSYGIYEQFTYGAEISSEVIHNTQIALRTAHVTDDNASLHTPGVTLPLQNTVMTLAGSRVFPSGNIVFDGEAAYSLYHRNTLSRVEKTKNDVGWFTRMRWTLPRYDIEMTYEHLGPDFDLGGNLSMRSLRDRRGPRMRITSPVTGWLKLRLDGNSYKDNLNRRKVFTTETFDGGIATDMALPANIALTLSYRTRIDKSDRAVDTAASVQQVNSRNEIYSATLRLPLRTWTLFAQTSTSLTRNANSYAPGVTLGGFKINSLNFNLGGPFSDKVDLQMGYSRTQTEFAVPPSIAVYQQYNARLGFRKLIPKGEGYLIARVNNNRGASQRELRQEYGGGLRWNAWEGRSLDVDYRRITDRYIPTDFLLNHEAHVADLRYTKVF